MNTIPTIRNLDELRKNLDLGPGYDGYIELMKAADIPATDLKKEILASDTRGFHLLYHTATIEAFVKRWRHGESSAIYNLNGSAEWIRTFGGDFQITCWSVDAAEGTGMAVDHWTLPSGGVSFLESESVFHQVTYLGENEGLSMHLLADPEDRLLIWDPELKRIFNRRKPYNRKVA